MKRKRNINFGFLPARPTRADLAKSRREFKAAVRRKTKETRAEFKRLRKAARSAKPAPGVGGKQKLEQLFHEVYGQNPRRLPEFTPEQMHAIEKLLRGKSIMAKKRKSKKKRQLPAGLKAYWARKRRAKAKRRNPKRRRNWGGKAKRRKAKTSERRRLTRLRKDLRRSSRRPLTRAERRYVNWASKPLAGWPKPGTELKASDWFRNPRKRKHVKRRKPPIKIIKTNLRKGTKAFAQFVREQRAKYGSARVL